VRLCAKLLWSDLGLPIISLWIVGLTNAYNFMDGIDGITGGHAVITGFSWVMLQRFSVE
jgi:UDP-N-acetylmuramyl pentapeptide phosphotransferase/UDP-N-acetylglucosamine-1-phosphate transferase